MKRAAELYKGKRSVPHGGISGLRKNCSVLAFAGILELVGWSARFYGYWRRRESSSSIDLEQRLATHATGGAGAGGQLAGCHGASRAPRAGSGATGREDRVAGNGVGAPKRTGQWRRQGIVVGVGLSSLASLRQASIFGSVAGRSAGSRRPRSLVGVGNAMMAVGVLVRPDCACKDIRKRLLLRPMRCSVCQRTTFAERLSHQTDSKVCVCILRRKKITDFHHRLLGL